MAYIGISESQFAFMFFHKFSNLHNDEFSKMVVPSTILEGKIDYEFKGTDLVLDNYFIQFKTSHYMVRPSSTRFKNDFSSRFLYFETDNESQYQFLNEYTKEPENHVWYVAPSASKTAEINPQKSDFWFNDFYRSDPNEIDDYSCIVSVRDVDWGNGWAKNDKHYVAFEHENDWYCYYSEPVKAEKIKITQLDNQSYFRGRGELELDIVLSSVAESLIDFDLNKNQNLFDQIKQVQELFLVNYNTFWIPRIENK